MKTRKIEVDFDIHKLIETHRTGFEESANSVLRRLLGLGEEVVSANQAKEDISQKCWRKGVVVLPSGTKLKMEHNKEQHFAEIIDGEWIDELGQKHTSASGAANSLARKSYKTTLNGKIYWQIKLPGSDHWIRYDEFERQSARKHQVSAED